MIDTTGPPEAEEKSYIQHHQASSYAVAVVQSWVVGSIVPCCSRQSGTKLGVVHGEARKDRCTGNSWSCQKVVVDEWESWNLQMMR